VPYYEDIKEIYESFKFDVFIADIAFTGAPLVKAKLNVPAIAVGVMPLGETSVDLPPSGLGLTPANSGFGKFKQSLMRWATDKFIFNKANKLYRRIFSEFGIPAPAGNVFDVVYRSATLVLQSGTANFEYKRSDLGENIRFIGPLLPYSTQKKQPYKLDHKYANYKSRILVTQGTVEKNPEKIIVPVLEAFRNTNHLVIATTGGSNTKELRERYPDENFIIEDFIPFNDIMPYCDVYVTNGGYGGVMLGIENNLPLVVAGIHEGKNEINARVGYFELGINLKTEFPKVDQVRKAILDVLADGKYKTNVIRLADDFKRYDSKLLCEAYMTDLTMKSPWATNIKRIHSSGDEKFIKVY
jgi:UDP:flavonoid glycosyltransferase YjiC (YdhE family)